VTFAQRFGSALNVNVHFHALLLDGVYVDNDGGDAPPFVETGDSQDDDIRNLVETIAARVLRLLARRGVIDEDEVLPDPMTEQSPTLAQMTAASVLDLVATGERSSVKRFLDGMGLPSTAPTIAPARASPQTDFGFECEDGVPF